MNPDAWDYRLTLPTAGESGRLYCFEHQAMGCTWGLLIAGGPPGSEGATERRSDEGRECLRPHVPTFPRSYAAQAARAVFAEIDRVEQELSRYLPTSDIARINALRAGEAVLIGADALECLELAAQVCADTNGAFDVTVGALLPPAPAGATERPGESATKGGDSGVPTSSRSHIPTFPRSSVVGSVRPAPVGMHLLQIDRATRRVRVEADGLVVDLGGVGKGFAIDQAIGILRDWSIEAALLHAGQSTVYALGRPPGAAAADVSAGRAGADWVIGIRDPQYPAAMLAEVRLHDAALSGSGTHLHGPHIIDPRTRQPAAEAIGAWAVAPAAALADALSTAFLLMRADEAAGYCEQHAEVAGLLLYRDTAGRKLRHFGRPLSWRPSAPQG